MKEKNVAVKFKKQQTSVKRRQDLKQDNTMKKRRKRKRKYALYYILFLIILLTTGIILSMTVFFNIENYVIKASDSVNKNEVIKGSNVELGRNLIRTNLGEVERNVLKTIVTLDSVNATRKFPNTLSIECIDAKASYSCKQDDESFVYLSIKGRVMSKDEKLPKEGTTVLSNVTLKNVSIGDFVDINGASSQTLIDLKTKIEKSGLKDISSIKITSSNSAEVVYQNRITIEIEDLSRASYMLESSAKILGEYIGAAENGRIFYEESNNSIHFLPNKN